MYEKLTDFASIYQAYKKTAKGKHDKNEVVRYETNLHMQLWHLKKGIENKTVKIGGYHRFMVFDPKKREIQALSFSGRVFQHLLCDRILMPYFEPKLIYDNAACRKNKGTHFAQNRFTGFLRDHYKKYGNKGYILKFDIKGYFSSIHHRVLKENLKIFQIKRLRNFSTVL